MGRHRDHVLYAAGRDQYYYNERLPSGKYRQVYLCKGRQNKRRAWKIYQEKTGAKSVTLPDDLRYAMQAPTIDVYREEVVIHPEHVDPFEGTPYGMPYREETYEVKRRSISPDNIETYLETIEPEQAKIGRQFFKQLQQWQESYGIEPGPITDKAAIDQVVNNRTKSIDAERVGRIALGMNDNVPTTIRMRDLLDCYLGMKSASQKPPTRNAIKQIKTRYHRLMAVIGGYNKSTKDITTRDIERGNRQLHDLTPQHLADFRYWITNQGLASSTCNDNLGIFGQITKFCRINKPDLKVPAHFATWNEEYLLKETVAESDDNKEPIPAETFRNMLKAAILKPTAKEPTTFGAKYSQRQKKYEAIRNAALLRFMVNFAADPIDCERLKWAHLSLDDELPACTLPRIKVEKKIGKPIKRNTPLLRSTVDALNQLKSYNGHGDFVFLDTEGNGPLTSSGISQAVIRIAKAAKAKRLKEDGTFGLWTAKYFRNVGSSLGVTWGHDLNAILIDRFLGQSIKTEAKKYIGKSPAESLIPIVNVIGEHYCEGETIIVARTT